MKHEIVYPIVGMRYREPEEQQYLSDLEGGEALLLVRQPDNPHDSNAVAVMSTDQLLHLGFIPAAKAKDLAPVMDGGGAKTLECTYEYPSHIKLEFEAPDEEEELSDADVSEHH